ncbi:MAG TPA: Hsp20/alpha crystallin family protein [Acidimicrobiales bacterium]|nr:Hsp20/alpha crystallin family protein [Acidimicrobiales bacterium]
MAHTEVSTKQRTLPVSFPTTTWPSWKWLDDFFRDGDMHQMIKIEEYREGDEMVVRAELPGVDPDKDVDVEVLDGALVISAEKTESSEKSERHFHRSEFRYGSLTRSIPIPSGVDKSNINAVYKDGVLEVRITMPKGSSPDTTRRIQVKRA